MFHRIRIAFMRQSADQLVTTAGAVVAGLANNPAFPAPNVDLKALQAAADELNAALVVQAGGGGTTATAEKRNKQEALISLLRKLKHYVEDHCGNDIAVLLSSGFQAASTSRDCSPLAIPTILSLNLGNRGELLLKISPIARAKCYEVQMAEMGADNVTGAWKNAGLQTSSRITIPDLVPGSTYVFQVRAIGATGYTDWSNPVSRMCA